ncbi:MAG: endonuclease NucS [Candidatus Diapherotrites archaeon]|nr:endonuclease NucS [Candidatus Diapherotrites archaeon]
MHFHDAEHEILTALKNRHMCLIIGECEVNYIGRASSKLPLGKRLVIIKADSSVSIHENRLIRPTNYMMDAKISCEQADKDGEAVLILTAKKLKPKETITTTFTSIDAINSYDLPESNDLRLSGSERELNDALMDDLSFLEPGLKPINQQQYFKKGICDIVAEDSQGRMVVIELKRRQADYAAVTQLKRYAEDIKKMRGVETRGILLAPSIRKTALTLLKQYGLEYFSYDFEIGERSKIKGIGKTQMKLSDEFG